MSVAPRLSIPHRYLSPPPPPGIASVGPLPVHPAPLGSHTRPPPPRDTAGQMPLCHYPLPDKPLSPSTKYVKTWAGIVGGTCTYHSPKNTNPSSPTTGSPRSGPWSRSFFFLATGSPRSGPLSRSFFFLAPQLDAQARDTSYFRTLAEA
eukprot:scaffold8059_cov82-Isochrysis_galbana.AAC.2